MQSEQMVARSDTLLELGQTKQIASVESFVAWRRVYMIFVIDRHEKAALPK